MAFAKIEPFEVEEVSNEHQCFPTPSRAQHVLFELGSSTSRSGILHTSFTCHSVHAVSCLDFFKGHISCLYDMLYVFLCPFLGLVAHLQLVRSPLHYFPYCLLGGLLTMHEIGVMLYVAVVD